MMLGRCAIEGSFFASSSISVNIRCNLQGKDAAGSMFMVAGFDLKGAAVMVQDEKCYVCWSFCFCSCCLPQIEFVRR